MLHKCKTCGGAFVSRNVLVQHEHTHLTEKLYSCVFCGKGFFAKRSLWNHILTEIREKAADAPCAKTNS